MPTVMVAGALAIFAYLSGHAQFANYLLIPHLPGTGELIIFCGALVGAGLGFLWFNTYASAPATMTVGMMARPSRPSVRFTALLLPTITK